MRIIKKHTQRVDWVYTVIALSRLCLPSCRGISIIFSPVGDVNAAWLLDSYRFTRFAVPLFQPCFSKWFVAWVSAAIAVLRSNGWLVKAPFSCVHFMCGRAVVKSASKSAGFIVFLSIYPTIPRIF